MFLSAATKSSNHRGFQTLSDWPTKLTKTGPAPQDFDQEVPFAKVKEINRIFVFGHSVGGGVWAMLSLRQNVLVQYSASSGGFGPREVFWGWSDDCTFNHLDQKECEILPGITFGHWAISHRPVWE